MTLKIELHAASMKRNDMYSPELCALSFMICLTGWESVFCKVSLSKYMWPSKVRAVTLYTEASKHLLWFEVTTSSAAGCSSCGCREYIPMLEVLLFTVQPAINPCCVCQNQHKEIEIGGQKNIFVTRSPFK